MSQVLSAKLTNKHLSIETLIYSWSIICMYALLHLTKGNVALLPIIHFFGHLVLGHLSRHVPRTKNFNYLEMS
jgi:hypothetical protein